MRDLARRLWIFVLLAAACGGANAAFHLWYIQQIYSNADGSVQFIEMQAYASGQQFVANHTLKVTQGSSTHSFVIPHDLPGDTSDSSGDYGGYYGPMASYKSMLIATQGFAALNIVTPDFVVPNGFLFQGNGVVNWGENSDTLSYTSLPTNGSARNRDGSTDAAVPKNFMGETGTITVQTAKTPAALSGLWWNAGESGWGIHFTQRGNNVFAAWYTYDTSGNPKWYVSTCAMPATTGTAGTCNGTLYEVNGPTFFGTAFNPNSVNAVNAGQLQVNFQDANNASMTYTGVAGQTRTVAITRQPLANGSTSGVNYTDLWWNPNESGWGMAITQQANTAFLAWYVYDANAKPTWFVATCTVSGSTCSGDLLKTTGPNFGATFDTSAVHASTAGTISVNFTGPNDATISYTVNGASSSKTVTRQLF